MKGTKLTFWFCDKIFPQKTFGRKKGLVGKISSSYYCDIYTIRPQKVNYLFLRHCPRHLQPPALKFFIAFPLFILKNHLYIAICQLRSAVICAILFVDWLVRILKVENFSGNYSDTSFITIF